jgi:single-strand DNA-binding protein
LPVHQPVKIISFVGGDPEQRQARNNGSKFTVLSVATQRSWKNAEEEWVSKVEWHRIAIFRPRLAEYVLNGIKKGAHVLVEGSLVSSTCEQANGKGKKGKTVKITSWSIRADVVRKLDRGEPELETVASGSGVASAPARFSKLYFPLRRQGRGFESRRSRQFPSAVGILKRQSKNSATHNAGKMKKKANSLVCQVCQLRAS